MRAKKRKRVSVRELKALGLKPQCRQTPTLETAPSNSHTAIQQGPEEPRESPEGTAATEVSALSLDAEIQADIHASHLIELSSNLGVEERSTSRETEALNSSPDFTKDNPIAHNNNIEQVTESLSTGIESHGPLRDLDQDSQDPRVSHDDEAVENPISSTREIKSPEAIPASSNDTARAKKRKRVSKREKAGLDTSLILPQSNRSSRRTSNLSTVFNSTRIAQTVHVNIAVASPTPSPQTVQVTTTVTIPTQRAQTAHVDIKPPKKKKRRVSKKEVASLGAKPVLDRTERTSRAKDYVAIPTIETSD